MMPVRRGRLVLLALAGLLAVLFAALAARMERPAAAAALESATGPATGAGPAAALGAAAELASPADGRRDASARAAPPRSVPTGRPSPLRGTVVDRATRDPVPDTRVEILTTRPGASGVLHWEHLQLVEVAYR